MLTGYDQKQLDQWRSSMHSYEKQKRTKKPFGKGPVDYNPIVKEAHVKEKQREFDPVLQKYAKKEKQQYFNQSEEKQKNAFLAKHLKNKKHQKTYDIVNLYPNADQKDYNPEEANEKWAKSKLQHNPVRNLYNIINNQSLPKKYYQNRNLRLRDHPDSKKVFHEKYRQPEFDIVKSMYLENNDSKFEADLKNEKEKTLKKLNEAHNFDNIYQRYYDESKEWEDQEKRTNEGKTHGKDFNKRLPPSYLSREPYLPNYEGDVPEAVQKIMQREENYLKRHKLRHLVEEQHRMRNEEEYQRKKSILKNRVHEGKILEHMAKEFDIVNNKFYGTNRSNLFEKKLSEHPYSYNFLHENNNFRTPRSSINEGTRRPSLDFDRYSQRSSSSRYSDFSRPSIKSGGFQ